MRLSNRGDWLARAATTIGALLPYLPLLSFNSIYVTDDGFASDIFNGELPARVLVGNLVAAGQAPVWTSSLCSGLPLAGAMEPLSLGIFSMLPVAPALCLFVIVLVLVAAHGAYGLARRMGAELSGAALAGIAYAGSGYMVTQLKHLTIICTVVWLPWGLLLLDRALASTPVAPIDASVPPQSVPCLWSRIRDLGLFGLIFAEQVCTGFPQSAYISALVYAAWTLALLPRLRGRVGPLPLWLMLGLLMALAVVIAGMCGAASLLPLADLGKVSDRKGKLPWEYASMLPYSFSDAWNFLFPYANGDVSDNTYHSSGFFWENYGYVGLATFLLGLWALVRGWRRPRVWLLFGIAVAAFSMVLGPRTPLYYLAWKYVPGMGQFRFPTRFLVVVDLMIAILGAVGLGLLRPDLTRLLRQTAPRIPSLLPPIVVLGTALDLFAHQTRQNPFVPASEWLATPVVVTKLGEGAPRARLYSPMHNFFHRLAFQTARGWSDLNPYRELRETIAPNTGVLWNVATADCYAGIGPVWHVDVWGDHSRRGLVVPSLMRLQRESIVATDRLSTVLGAFGVTHLVSPLPIRGAHMTEIPDAGAVHLYEIPGKRARIVAGASLVASNLEAAKMLLAPGFDPDREVLLHDTGGDSHLEIGNPVDRSLPLGEAQVVDEDSTRLLLKATAPQGGYLLLADTFYPGWRATIDGNSTPLYRANLSVRAIRLTPGTHWVQFVFEPAAYQRGLRVTQIGLTLVALWLLVAQYFARRSRRGNHTAGDPGSDRIASSQP